MTSRRDNDHAQDRVVLCTTVKQRQSAANGEAARSSLIATSVPKACKSLRYDAKALYHVAGLQDHLIVSGTEWIAWSYIGEEKEA